MKIATATLLASLLLLPLAAAVDISVAIGGDDVVMVGVTDEAVGGGYAGGAGVWQETNGLAGLQKVPTCPAGSTDDGNGGCVDGDGRAVDAIPADAQVA